MEPAFKPVHPKQLLCIHPSCDAPTDDGEWYCSAHKAWREEDRRKRAEKEKPCKED
jgi:hypothetical protein